jgi:hypothetical protein
MVKTPKKASQSALKAFSEPLRSFGKASPRFSKLKKANA